MKYNLKCIQKKDSDGGGHSVNGGVDCGSVSEV